MATTCCGQESYIGQLQKGDRRLELIKGIRELIGSECQADQRPKKVEKRTGNRQPMRGVRNMDDECKEYRKRRDCTPPTITAVSTKEIRPTSEYDKLKYENSPQVTFVDVTKPDKILGPTPPAPWDLPRKPSQELRSGTLYQGCDCLKRNGLQQDCPRWGCNGRPECVATSPGPCCWTSKARKPVRGDRRNKKIVGYSSPTTSYGKGGHQDQGSCTTGEGQPYGPTQDRSNPQSPQMGQQIFGFIMGFQAPAGVQKDQGYQQPPAGYANQQQPQSGYQYGKETVGQSNQIVLTDGNQMCICKPASGSYGDVCNTVTRRGFDAEQAAAGQQPQSKYQSRREAVGQPNQFVLTDGNQLCVCKPASGKYAEVCNTGNGGGIGAKQFTAGQQPSSGITPVRGNKVVQFAGVPQSSTGRGFEADSPLQAQYSCCTKC